jgi:hypothetical protein
MAEGGRRSSDTSVGAVKADIFTKEFAHLMFMKLVYRVHGGVYDVYAMTDYDSLARLWDYLYESD